MRTFGIVILLFVSVFVLIKSADLTLEALKSLTRKLHAKAFVVSAIILAIATSLPELFVGITSALEGSSNLSLGNILGANIANLSLVVGLSAMVSGGVFIHEKIVSKEILLAAGAGALPIFLFLDGTLSRVDGIILLAVYLAYATSFFKVRFLEIGKHHLRGRYFLRFVRHLEEVEQKADKTLGHLFVGIAALLFSANFIVKIAREFAEVSGIPIFVVGVVLLSLGTTLPEVVVSMESLKKGQPGVFFGNILGSLIVNSTLILGIVAVISPVRDGDLKNYLTTLIAFVIIFFLFWLFTRTKLRLERWEAGVLLAIYIVFVVVEFL